MFTIENTACLLYLLALSAIDISKRKIPAPLLAAGCLGAAAIRIALPKAPPLHVLLALTVGLIFLLISYATREQIGYGDSILIMGLGIFSGVLRLLEILLAAFTMAAVFSAAALITRKFKRGARYPFVPFLAAAFFAMVCLRRMG